jgi:hypothetical protein
MDNRRTPRPEPATAPDPAPIPTLKLALIRAQDRLARAASALLSGRNPFARRVPGPEAVPRPNWAGRDAIRARPRRTDRTP